MHLFCLFFFPINGRFANIVFMVSAQFFKILCFYEMVCRKVKGVSVPFVLCYEHSSNNLLEHTVSGDECLEQFVLFALTILFLT